MWVTMGVKTITGKRTSHLELWEADDLDELCERFSFLENMDTSRVYRLGVLFAVLLSFSVSSAEDQKRWGQPGMGFFRDRE